LRQQLFGALRVGEGLIEVAVVFGQEKGQIIQAYALPGIDFEALLVGDAGFLLAVGGIQGERQGRDYRVESGAAARAFWRAATAPARSPLRRQVSPIRR